MYFTSDDGSQNMFVYQATLDTLGLKKDKSIDCVISLKSKGVYLFKLTPLCITFLNSTKLCGYKTGTKFDNSF